MRTNEEIIDGFRKGNADIIVYVYNELLSNAKAIIKNRGGTEKEADDLLWDAITKFYLRIRRNSLFEKDTSDNLAWRKYIITICMNTWNDWKTREHKKPSFSKLSKGDKEIMDFILYTKFLHAPVDRKIKLQQASQIILETIDSLKEKCKQYFRLRIEGLENSEIAKRLGVKKDTPRKQNFECKGFLREAVLNSPYIDELLEDFPFLLKFTKNNDDE